MEIKKTWSKQNYILGLLINNMLNKYSWWADWSIYLILFNNYIHQVPMMIGLGLIDISFGLCKLSNR